MIFKTTLVCDTIFRFYSYMNMVQFYKVYIWLELQYTQSIYDNTHFKSTVHVSTIMYDMKGLNALDEKCI